MTAETRKDCLDRLRLSIIGCQDIEQDSSLAGRIRIRAAAIKKHLTIVEAAIRLEEDRGHNDHLGAVSEEIKR